MIQSGDRLLWGGQTVEVVTVLSDDGDRFSLILEGPAGLTRVTLTKHELADARQPANEGQGNSAGAIAGLWGKWMEWASPRIRSCVKDWYPPGATARNLRSLYGCDRLDRPERGPASDLPLRAHPDVGSGRCGSRSARPGDGA